MIIVNGVNMVTRHRLTAINRVVTVDAAALGDMAMVMAATTVGIMVATPGAHLQDGRAATGEAVISQQPVITTTTDDRVIGHLRILGPLE